jgi:hypothetical protein
MLAMQNLRVDSPKGGALHRFLVDECLSVDRSIEVVQPELPILDSLDQVFLDLEYPSGRDSCGIARSQREIRSTSSDVAYFLTSGKLMLCRRWRRAVC